MRQKALNCAIYIFFSFLIGALFYTQMIRFPYYNRLARNNAIRVVPIDGPRGNMFDRDGKGLVTNRLSFDVALVYQDLKSLTRLINILSRTLDLSRDSALKALEKSAGKPYVPVTIVEDIGREKAFALEEASVDMRGLIIETRSKRHYVHNESGCHVYGYLSEISEKELEDLRESGYRPKDLIGRDGLEKLYNEHLAGVDGGTQIEVDSRGRKVRTLGLKEPVSGKDLYLTIDADLQETADKLVGDRKGAVVVMDPRNGEILALTSHPAFDPNLFVRPNTGKQKLELIKDKTGRPLLNRAISGSYPPGSVFKIVISDAALETGKINKNTTFNCNGSFSLGRARFDCWKAEGHGPQNIFAAIKHSCNVFFYNIGKLLGPDNIEAYSRLFGFGRPTGIDLPDEAKGNVPGRHWKRAKGKGAWYEGDTINYAIGQGYLVVTPIQVVQMTSVIANGGKLAKPHIVKRIGDKDLKIQDPKDLGLKAGFINTIREGMLKCVNDEDGTGKHSKSEYVVVAGKTGTAQNPQGKTHGWYTGYAPYNDPRICLIVFLEHGGKGGMEPASIAKGIFEKAKDKGYY